MDFLENNNIRPEICDDIVKIIVPSDQRQWKYIVSETDLVCLVGVRVEQLRSKNGISGQIPTLPRDWCEGKTLFEIAFQEITTRSIIMKVERQSHGLSEIWTTRELFFFFENDHPDNLINPPEIDPEDQY